MEINTKYHGIIEYNEDEIITFKKGIPGFESLSKFILFPLEENDEFKILHSVEDEKLGLLVISPFSIEKDYEIKLSERVIGELKIADPTEVMVVNTVTLDSDIKKCTTNLQAPIIINTTKRLGEQIIMDNGRYNIKYPLFKEWWDLLVLTRKKGESVLIGEDIEITVIKTDDGGVKLAINAPKNIIILRKELYKEVQNENERAMFTNSELLKNIKKIK